MNRQDFAELVRAELGLSQVTKVISRAKERGMWQKRMTDFPEEEVWEVINWELEKRDTTPKRDEFGHFIKGEHYNEGYTRTEEQKKKYSEATSKVMANPEQKAKYYGPKHSEEQKAKWSEMRKGVRPWNYDTDLHKIIELSGYCSQTVRKYGWTLDDYKEKNFHVSICEDEIVNFIKSIYSGEIETNNRKIISPKEIDIYIPEKKLAIEFDGLYWHSSAVDRIYKSYHYDKTIACEEKGIRLIHIYEDEWKYKKEIIKSMISSGLGIYKKKYFARNLTFKVVPNTDGCKFFEENHIDGDARAIEYYGLYDGEELVQCISLRKNFAVRSKEKPMELARMATKINCQVLGGFSKLMKNQPYEFITSFVDRAKFDAKGYISSDWKIVGESEPGYYYTDLNRRYNRQNFMKQTCLKRWPESNPNLTEKEICAIHNFYQIYNCGCIKLEYSKA